LTSHQSTFNAKITDTLLEINKSILKFQILDEKGEAIPFAIVRIKNSVKDTTILSDFDGFVSANLTSGTFSISILYHQYTPINIDNFFVKENAETTIKASLGLSNALRIALIYSIRKLKDEEIEKLIDDLSNNRENNELIINKTCYVMWEI